MINLRVFGAGLGLIAGMASADLPTDTLQGHVTANKTLDAGHVWILKGRVTVDSAVTLTIEPGTTVKGQYSTRGTLAVSPRAYMVAAGTKDKPITFTATEEKRGGWGGIVLLGRAPTNEPTKYFEAVPEWAYGGNDAHDSSGVLTYVTINYPGFAVEVDKELNGLTMCGVGDKTVIHHVQSNNGDDDGFEFFGGTVNVANLVSTNQVDDGFDMDNGYGGSARWMIQIQGKDPAQARHYYFYDANGDTLKYTDGPKAGQYHDTTYTESVGDNGIEASSNPVAGKVPQTHPRWSNLTLIDNGVGKGPFQGKEDLGGAFDRMLLVGDSSAWAVSMLDQATANNFIAAAPTLAFTRTYLTGTFKTKWNVIDTSVVGKGAKTLLDSTIKAVDSALYTDLGLASKTLADDSVGAVLGDDTADYWYKGWTLPGTVVYAKGKTRAPSSAIAARSASAFAGISSLELSGRNLVIVAGGVASARIEILDLSGRTVADLGKVDLHAGRNVFGGIRALESGLYFLKAAAHGATYSAKVLVEAKR
jgi:hypothetical protein